MTTQNLQCADSGDDAYEAAPTGWCGITPTYLWIGQVGSGRHNGMRFPGVTGLSGATVDSATLTFRAQDTDSGSFVGDWYAENAAAPPIFANGNYNITNRTLTAETCEGDGSDFGNWTAGGDPTFEGGGVNNIADIIQALADAYNPSAIVLIHKYTSGTGERTAKAYDNDSALAPKLQIITTAGGGDALVTAVAATATALAGVATIAVGAGVTAVVAAATALAGSATIGAGVGVTAVAATATALAGAPTLGAGVGVAAVAAAATALGGAPAVAGDGEVAVVAAVTATASAVAPVVSGTGDALVAAVGATATALAGVPGVAGDAALAAVVATATALAGVTAVAGGAGVIAVTTTATALGGPPTVAAIRNVTVVAVAGTATALAGVAIMVGVAAALQAIALLGGLRAEIVLAAHHEPVVVLGGATKPAMVKSPHAALK